MICGIGTDIVEIIRIRDAVEKWGDRFLKKIFSNNEITYCFKKKSPHVHLAARFAAKEAFFKASNIHCALPDIEVLNEPTGRPYINLREDLLNVSCRSEHVSVHLTMSHEKTHAVATVILERTEK